MDNKIDYWQKLLTKAIESERNPTFGKAGETPLTDIADKLRFLSKEDSGFFINALVNLINKESQNKLFWQSVEFLTGYIKYQDVEELKSAFILKMNDASLINLQLNSFPLRCYLILGGRLTPKDIKRLENIQTFDPIAWLEAFVYSTHFSIAKEFAIKLLKAKRLNVKYFVYTLDSWHQIWDRNENFYEVVSSFREAVTEENDIQLFEKWFASRNIEKINTIEPRLRILKKTSEFTFRISPSYSNPNPNPNLRMVN